MTAQPETLRKINQRIVVVRQRIRQWSRQETALDAIQFLRRINNGEITTLTESICQSSFESKLSVDRAERINFLAVGKTIAIGVTIVWVSAQCQFFIIRQAVTIKVTWCRRREIAGNAEIPDATVVTITTRGPCAFACAFHNQEVASSHQVRRNGGGQRTFIVRIHNRAAAAICNAETNVQILTVHSGVRTARRCIDGHQSAAGFKGINIQICLGFNSAVNREIAVLVRQKSFRRERIIADEIKVERQGLSDDRNVILLVIRARVFTF